MSVGLSILMPVYNELDTVERAIDEALAIDLPVDFELIIVDDGSTDGTRALLQGMDLDGRARLILHDRNRGKGAALRTAAAEAQGTYSTVLDADLEYEAQSIGMLLQPLLENDAEVVYGVRGFQSHSAYNFWYVVGNKAVTFATNVLYNSWLSDIMTCHKVLRTDLLQSLKLRERGFGIEPEITARLLRKGVRIYEVPITYTARSRDKGKKLTSMDGIRVLRTLVRCRVD